MDIIRQKKSLEISEASRNSAVEAYNEMIKKVINLRTTNESEPIIPHSYTALQTAPLITMRKQYERKASTYEFLSQETSDQIDQLEENH